MPNLLHFLRYKSPLTPYRERADQLESWLARYPGDVDGVQRFLQIVNEAFLLGKRERGKIGPDDDIMQLYQACTHAGWGLPVDSMELEHLVMLSEEAFHCAFPRDIDLTGWTFGRFFEEIKRLATAGHR